MKSEEEDITGIDIITFAWLNLNFSLCEKNFSLCEKLVQN